MRSYYALFLLLVCSLSVGGDTPASPLDVTIKSLEGNDIDLAKTYEGKVCMIVNVPSKCSLTEQHEQLAELHERYHARGLEILVFPCNDFGADEPGTNEEIKMFFHTNFGEEFELFDRISVQGEHASPLYKYLTSTESNGTLGGEIERNFTKFLVDRGGNVVARFKPGVKSDTPELVTAIEDALAADPSVEDEWSDSTINTLSGQAVL